VRALRAGPELPAGGRRLTRAANREPRTANGALAPAAARGWASPDASREPRARAACFTVRAGERRAANRARAPRAPRSGARSRPRRDHARGALPGCPATVGAGRLRSLRRVGPPCLAGRMRDFYGSHLHLAAYVCLDTFVAIGTGRDGGVWDQADQPEPVCRNADGVGIRDPKQVQRRST
jgi:hypothetical protein